MGAERRMDRKTFLKEGPLHLIRAFFQGANEGETKGYRPPAEDLLIRPPGAARPEARFLEVCLGSSACSIACPANAIRMVPRRDDPGLIAPLIRPSEAACVLCEDLSCMKACPTGALTLLPREEIRIGLAVVYPEKCFAWSGEEPSCSACADRCPIGAAAIAIEERDGAKGPVVREAGCTGCGVCEFYCPVYPAAVRIRELAEG
ncbi:MAG: 4Fe-4S dicluster domain-containing protein [Candidatus Tectomicrobia bacterium]|uniref:4Fe-4S dicluster domain-containing protein n=1 Tax=Tectimicrobiota bacterium TaxID=2528274 RepID=A0A932MPA2_UNCTE|nr:4Fe-4S dicluster domain-containing protein [Candidatus Tectomicrobia bacterium]